MLLTNQVTLPLLGSTLKLVPFVSIEYVRFADVLLEANIWKLYIVLNVTLRVAGP